MIRILVTNQKGGVGKSTITANLCRYFASIRNKKTTLLDFDSQASSSRWVKQVQQ
ncbi:MAG: ParA family protein [Burkholderiaceae bacterium]